MLKTCGFIIVLIAVGCAAEPNEKIRASFTKVKKLTPQYQGGGDTFQETGNEEFVFVQHINSSKRKDEHDPLILSSSARGTQTVWIKVPEDGTLGIIGNIRVPAK